MLKKMLRNEGLELADEKVEKLRRFSEILHEWNGIHNLTGAKRIGDIYDNIIDSLFPLTFITIPDSLLDVGTGAGFPGLVLAIALPDTKVVLAEPLKKRSSFLRYAAIDLELKNVTVEGKRVEELAYSPFELISSRAVTNTRLLLKLTKKVSDEKTAYLFYKGERVFDEIDEAGVKMDYEVIEKNRRNYLYIAGSTKGSGNFSSSQNQ